MPHADDDPRLGRFGLRTDCPSCGAHLPVNGPAQQVECADCGEQVAVPKEVLCAMLDDFEEGWPTPSARQTRTVGDMTWRWTAEVADGPACPSCAQAIALPDAPQEGLLPCPSCQATLPVERMPARLRKAVQGSAWVIAGEIDQSRQSPPAPVALACPSCGAGLSITSRHHRITPCDHCGSRVHLPDAVWRALHPPRKVEPWWVRFEGESRKARAQRLQAEEALRKKKEKEEKAKKQAEERARKAEKQAREAQAREKARKEKEAREAGEAQRRAWTGYPLVVLGALAQLLAWGSGLFAAAFFLAGHTRWMRSLGLSALAVNLAEDALVVVAIGLALLAWLLGNLGATRVAGTFSWGLIAWCAFMLIMCGLPFVGPFFGLFFAWQHLTGSEPTVGNGQTVPRLASAPLAPLYVGAAPLMYLAFAAFGRTALGSFLH